MQKIYLAAFILSSLALPAVAQSNAPVLTGPPTATGARPGNEIGTGSSLPMSDRASNITPGNSRSNIAPNLPSPSIAENASPREYLRAARESLAQGRTGMAQQSLEMAESRLLDRSVAQLQTNDASRNELVAGIADARRALGDGNHTLAMQLIDRTLGR